MEQGPVTLMLFAFLHLIEVWTLKADSSSFLDWHWLNHFRHFQF